MPKRWTADEEAQLFHLSSLHSIDQLAKKYGVTTKSVAVKLQKLRQAMRKSGVSDVMSIPRQRASIGGEAKKWTPEEELQLLDMHRMGWRSEKIATHFGVSQKAVSVKLLKVKKKIGSSVLPTLPEKLTIDPVEQVVKAAKPVPVVQATPVKPAAPPPQAPPIRPQPVVRPPIQGKGPQYGKQQEGEANTQFKVWNGTEWITIKIAKKLIHV
ncbi:MAG: hypothetical protein OEM52_05290 [bacterium]|nr:hypothetical protein [bacterium]